MIISVKLDEENFMGDSEFAAEFSKALHEELVKEFSEWDVFVSVEEGSCVNVWDVSCGFNLEFTFSASDRVDLFRIHDDIQHIRDTLWNNWKF